MSAKCLRCGAGPEWLQGKIPSECSDDTKRGGSFYNGMEWLGAWLVDYAEGETITEELIRRWCVESWREHLSRAAMKREGK